jgi:hypothetical protein
MEILYATLCLQVILNIKNLFNEKEKKIKILILTSIILVLGPFLSYTYPIVIFPVFASLILFIFRNYKSSSKNLSIATFICFIIILPLFISFLIDIRHVIEDNSMQLYWKKRLFDVNNLNNIVVNFLDFLMLMGSGYLFKIVFAMILLVSIVSILFSTTLNKLEFFRNEKFLVEIYSIQVVFTALILYFLGKLPLGESRLNCFIVVAFSVLIVHGANLIQERYQMIPKNLVFGVIIFASVGNISISLIGKISQKDKETFDLQIYENVGRAIKQSDKIKLPLIVLPGIASAHFEKEYDDASWILKTHPKFKKENKIKVFGIKDESKIKECLKNNKLQTAILVDKYSFQLVNQNQ